VDIIDPAFLVPQLFVIKFLTLDISPDARVFMLSFSVGSFVATVCMILWSLVFQKLIVPYLIKKFPPIYRVIKKSVHLMVTIQSSLSSFPPL
jgi:hypothetical protein